MLAQTSLLALAALLPFSLAQISDGFENGWSNNTWPVYAPDCNQGGTVVLDSTVAHSGKNSLKVTGGSSGYCGHIFFGTTAVPTGDVFVRAWMRHTLPLADGHVTFIVMPDSGLAGKHLRLSGQEEIFEYNRESDDATLPDLSPNGVASSTGFPTSTWECVEYNLKSDGTIQTWVNDQLISGLTVGPGITNANSNGWGSAYKPTITGVYFGWESYGGTVDTVWYDDIAIASSRVGCSAAGGSSATPVGPASSTGTPKTTAPASSSTPVTSAKPTTSSAPVSSKPTTTSAAPTSAKPTTSAAPTSSVPANCQIVYVDL